METTGLKRHTLRRRGKKRGDSRIVECKLTNQERKGRKRLYYLRNEK